MSSSPLRSSPTPQASSPASIALVALVAILALIVGSVTGAALPRDSPADFRVLVFSGRSAAATPDPVPAAVSALRRLGAENGFGVEATDDPAVFEDDGLARFDTVVFNNTASAQNGALDSGERAALRRYIRAGGGWVGLHDASADTGDWDWYEGLVGAELDRATSPQTGRIRVLDHAHPSTVTLPDLWEHTEHWPSWRADPGAVHPLARIRVGEGVDHPWSWCQNYDGGRSWFTAGGSVPSAFEDEAFLAHLLGGIEWAAGAAKGDCTATQAGAFRRTALAAGGLTDPVDVAVAPDRRVFVAERTGELKAVDQRTARISTALDLAYAPEAATRSDGLIALALDPGFEENGRLYLLHTGATGSRLHLSRFTMRGTRVDPASEKRLISLPGRRSTSGGASSSSGSLAFDAAGHLYAASGDSTLPSASAASEDLRGAILRITPQDDGTYTVPEGNLFAPGTAGTAPEIYATGMRNPYRFTVDRKGGALLIADDGTDGAVGYSRITEAGRIGRPYCAGGAPGDPVCAPRVAGSPGATDQAPAAGAMSGPVYAYDPGNPYRTGFPEYFAGKWLTYDRTARRFRTLSFQRSDQVFPSGLPKAESGELQSVDGVFGDMEWGRPAAAVFGPDGALYVIDPGLGSGTDGEGGSEGEGVFRIDHVGDGRFPEAGITSDRDNGSAPLTVTFTGRATDTGTTTSAGAGAGGGTGARTDTGAGPGSRPAAAERVTYAWDFDGDGVTDSTQASPSYTYRTAGLHTARLTVTVPGGASATAGRAITVGNTRPRVTVRRPSDGGLFRFGDTIGLTVDVADEEDGGGVEGGARADVDCSRVLVRSLLGHPTRLLPRAGSSGCHGSIATKPGAGTGAGLHRVTVEYTDEGARGAPELTGSAWLTLRTAFQEAERFTSTGGGHGGAVAGSRAHTSDGRALTEIEDGDWVAFAPVDLAGVRSVTVGATPCGLGGTVQFRSGSPSGPLLGSLPVPAGAEGGGATRGGGVVSRTAELRSPGGDARLYLVFLNARWRSEAPDLFTVDWLRFGGPRTG
ncbi:ThuA domain-containing protein [Streptomyces sp. NPDC047737]|uniref:ThuA domain-containing protein n=1 Tax=Streptomyces sp. NPDC047737 TaxID=3155740 RepID=UPI0033D799DA